MPICTGHTTIPPCNTHHNPFNPSLHHLGVGPHPASHTNPIPVCGVGHLPLCGMHIPGCSVQHVAMRQQTLPVFQQESHSLLGHIHPQVQQQHHQQQHPGHHPTYLPTAHHTHVSTTTCWCQKKGNKHFLFVWYDLNSGITFTVNKIKLTFFKFDQLLWVTLNYHVTLVSKHSEPCINTEMVLVLVNSKLSSPFLVVSWNSFVYHGNIAPPVPCQLHW